MTAYRVGHFLEAAAAQRREMTQALGTAEQARRAHLAGRASLADAANQADGELGRILLPEIQPTAVVRAIGLTGYEPLHQLIPTLEQERASLRERLAGIEADPRFRDRELQRHPRTGSLVTQLAQLEEMRATFQPVFDACDHPRMQELLASGYGTPSYAVGFWRLSYYRDWEAGDEIVARMKKENFAQVLAEYTPAVDSARELDGSIAQLKAEIGAGETLDREHATAAEALRTLDARHLAHAQGLLVKHLLEADKTRTGALLEREPNVRLFALKSQAAHAKLEYLDGLFAEKVEKFAQATKVALDKLDRDVAKYQRPKNANVVFPAEAFERRFRDPRARYQKHWDRYRTTYQTIWVYDDYDRGRWVSDFLWWDVMTHHMDGGYIPSVSQHHQVYGTQDYDGSDDFGEAGGDAEAAAATAALEVERGGSDALSSSFDPS